MKRYDYHTHNGYSGCASKLPYSIKEGWNVIQGKGVTKYGISNHYPNPSIYGEYLPKLRTDIEALDNDQILLGVEIELDQEEGLNKLPKEDMELIDYMIGSAHHLRGGFLMIPDITAEEIQEFFDYFRLVLINSFTNIPIKIWGHPFLNEYEIFGDKYWKDYMRPLYLECLDLCAERQIAIELTPQYFNKCQKQLSTFKVLDEMYSLAMENPEIYFVTSSDGHNLMNLGELRIPMEYVKKFNIPDSRILEIHKKP